MGLLAFAQPGVNRAMLDSLSHDQLNVHWLSSGGAELDQYLRDQLTLDRLTVVAKLRRSRHNRNRNLRDRRAKDNDAMPDPSAAAQTSIEFASLLCSRLCHDLLSPVGALNNGIELLADEHDPEMRARCMELLAASAKASANKLKFFRLAFGSAGGFADLVDTREAQSAIEGLFGGEGRIELGWLVSEAALPKPAIKILLNLALLAGDALVRGGRLDVGAENGEIVIRAEGPRLVLDPELKAAMTGGVSQDQVTPRNAAAFLVHALASEQGGAIMVSEVEDGVLVFGARLR
jgi:histidine phosphotransferase ChpT